MRMDIAAPCGHLGLHVGDTINDWHGKTPVRRERWRRGIAGWAGASKPDPRPPVNRMGGKSRSDHAVLRFRRYGPAGATTVKLDATAGAGLAATRRARFFQSIMRGQMQLRTLLLA